MSIWKRLLSCHQHCRLSLSCIYGTDHASFQFVTAIHQSSRSASMVRVLNVAEKNDAAKSLANLISRGGFRRREGLSKFNKLYEFDYNLFGQNCSMTMTSVSGHLLDLQFVGPYKKWYGCNPVQLFDATVEKYCPQDFVDIKRTLERETRGCQSLIIWTDCDREGENIGFEVIQVCKKVKPNIRVYRARFSEITPQAVQRALANLQEPDENTSNAVDVRQELDLRIGAAFTRFQTLRLQKVFPAVLADQLVSYGSCQFPTLGFVVERYKQVQAFVPEPFWKIAVTLETEEDVVEFVWRRQRLFDHLACLVLYQHCLEVPEATVTDVKSKPKSKWRPAALETVELEKLASRKLKINAKETMKIAEKLYTQGFISYPRTETNIFPKDLDLANLIQQQTNDPNWGGFAAQLLQRGPTPRNGNKTDQAHPPIHPTKYTNNLQGNEQRVYEFIVRHFLACCSQDAQGHETTVEIEINQEQFSAQGLMILARNYLDVYPYDRWTGKILPVFQVGSVFQPKAIEMNQSETSPPSLLTEADLIALMDKHGIGTDATHADHIETIKSRMYVGVRPDGKFVPGELGMGLVDGYDAMGFEMSKPHLRANLESALKGICQGRQNPDEVLAEQIRRYREVFIEAVQQANKIDAALSEYFGAAEAFRQEEIEVPVIEPVKPCPNCGQQMILKTKKDGGYFVTCSGYPNCRNAIWFPSFVLSATADEAVCSQCQPGPVKKIKFKFKRGSVPPYIPEEYTGCIGGCDETLCELLDIRKFKSPPSSNTQQSNTNKNRTTSSGYTSSNNGTSTQKTASHRTPLTPVNGPRMLNSRGRGTNTTGSQRGHHSGGTGRGGTGKPSGHLDGADNNTVVCRCGEDARLLTVRKEGPNTGRQFYSCVKPQESKCDFFLWADEDRGDAGGAAGPTRGQHQQPENQNANRQTSYGGPGGDSSDVKCGCGNDAKLLIVHKEGPNKGRQFYGCPAPREQGCGFFQWADEPGGGDHQRGAQAGGWGRGNRGGGGAGEGNYNAGGSRNQGDGGSAKTKRKCGLCRQEGHNKKNCPQNR